MTLLEAKFALVFRILHHFWLKEKNEVITLLGAKFASISEYWNEAVLSTI